MSFRWFIPSATRAGGVYVTATFDEGKWHLAVTDVRSLPVDEETRKDAIKSVLRELSSLRSFLWHDELKNPRQDPNSILES